MVPCQLTHAEIGAFFFSVLLYFVIKVLSFDVTLQHHHFGVIVLDGVTHCRGAGSLTGAPDSSCNFSWALHQGQSTPWLRPARTLWFNVWFYWNNNSLELFCFCFYNLWTRAISGKYPPAPRPAKKQTVVGRPSSKLFSRHHPDVRVFVLS